MILTLNNLVVNGLKVSFNHLFLVRENGMPFFWLGDTIWELFHRATLVDAEYYLENRRQIGFTVLQAVVLAEFDGLKTPNVYGELPLHDQDPLKPNEKYFRHVDQVIELAGKKSLFIGLLPTWGDKIELLGHGKGLLLFNPENAFQYGQWIGRRYRDCWNVIWIGSMTTTRDRRPTGRSLPARSAIPMAVTRSGSCISRGAPDYCLKKHGGKNFLKRPRQKENAFPVEPFARQRHSIICRWD